MAVARHFGWQAVAGPDRMDWRAFALARQYLVEEFIGALIREERKKEQRQARASSKHIPRS